MSPARARGIQDVKQEGLDNLDEDVLYGKQHPLAEHEYLPQVGERGE